MNDSGNVEAEVADEGEGMCRVNGQRSQHRKHRMAEGVADPLLLLLVQLAVIQQLHVVVEQLFAQLFAVVVLLLLQQGYQPFANGQQLFERRLSVFAGGGDASFHLRLQGRHAHHEELIKVVAEDGAELGLVQQGGALIQRLGEDSLVEGDPAQFPVDVAVRAQNGGAHGRFGAGSAGSAET